MQLLSLLRQKSKIIKFAHNERVKTEIKRPKVKINLAPRKLSHLASVTLGRASHSGEAILAEPNSLAVDERRSFL